MKICKPEPLENLKKHFFLHFYQECENDKFWIHIIQMQEMQS